MTEWLPFIVVGVTSGSIYALAAMGLVLTFKTSGVFNFAHGAQSALAAYLMFELRDRSGLAWPVAALITLAVAGVLTGLVLEMIGRALSTAPPAARVGATVGMLVGIQGALFAVFGSERVAMRYFLPTDVVHVLGVSIRIEQILVTGFVFVSAVALYWYLSRTRLGVATLALVDDPTLLGLTGTRPVAIRRTAWAVGATFAALSGMLLAPTAGLDAGILTLLVFYAFGAASLGAFQSLPLTYGGALAIGVTAELMKKYLTTGQVVTALPATLPFLVLFAVLILMPKERLVERGSRTVRRALPPRRLPTRIAIPAATAMIAVLLAVPPLAGTRTVTFVTALCYVVLFGSLSLLVRTSGQISLCHMTFAAFGGVTFAHAVSGGIPWPLAVLLGGVVAVPVGALVAIPAIRVSGVYLAIATFGFALVVQNLVFPMGFMFATSKVYTAPRPHLGFLHTSTDTGYYYVVLAVTAVCLAAIVAVRRSRLGRLLRGLAEGAPALDAHGANTNVTKVLVFCCAAFFAGIAGALIGPVTGTVVVPHYDFSISLLLVAVLFIAGRQPVLGAFVAAALYVVVPAYVPQHLLKWTPVVFGIGAVGAAMFGGIPILDRLRTSRRALERRPRAAARPAAVAALAMDVDVWVEPSLFEEVASR